MTPLPLLAFLLLLLSLHPHAAAAGSPDPTPTPWPHQFHAALLMGHGDTLVSLVNLWYDWPGGRILHEIRSPDTPSYDAEWNNGTSFFYTPALRPGRRRHPPPRLARHRRRLPRPRPRRGVRRVGPPRLDQGRLRHLLRGCGHRAPRQMGLPHRAHFPRDKL